MYVRFFMSLKFYMYRYLDAFLDFLSVYYKSFCSFRRMGSIIIWVIYFVIVELIDFENLFLIFIFVYPYTPSTQFIAKKQLSTSIKKEFYY